MMYAVRTLWRRGFAALVLPSLAIGIGANMAIFYNHFVDNRGQIRSGLPQDFLSCQQNSCGA